MSAESPQDRHPDPADWTPNDVALSYGPDGTEMPDSVLGGDSNAATADTLFLGGQTAPMDLSLTQLFDGTTGTVDADGIFHPKGGDA
jgi:hypothetical protein